MAFQTPRFYTKDGQKLPSVTTILGILNKPALVPWAANAACDYILANLDAKETHTSIYLHSVVEAARKNYRTIGRQAMDIGSTVHEIVHGYLKTGTEPKIDSEPVLAGFLAFLEWVDTHKVEPFESEITVYGDGYAGTTDLVAFVDGKLTLVDMKVSKGIYDEYPLQIAAYRAAYPGNLEASGILRLDKETGYPEWKDFSSQYEHDLRAFLLLKDYWLNRREASHG